MLVPVVARPTALPPALSAFKQAWQRIAQGQADQPDPPAVQALPIYPYLVAARLQRDLAGPQAQQADARVAAFLKAHRDQPVSRELTTHWLRALARRHDWPMLIRHYDAARADAALRCQWLQARIATGDTEGLVPLVVKRYLTGHSLPQCAPAFDWLEKRGHRPPPLVEERIRLALEDGRANFARQLMAALPKADAAPLERWAALISTPQQALRTLIAHPQQQVSQRALQDGWFRLARSHPGTALALYPQLLRARQLRAADADPYTRALALGLAWDRRPQALTYFERFTPAPDDTMALTWRVRAALWALDWKRVDQWIAAMPQPLRSTPAWQYWQARAEQCLGDAAAAHRALRALANTDGYYPLLAAWRLSRDYTPQPTPLANDPKLRHKLARTPGIRRAHELFEVDLKHRATTEWLAALAQATPDERLQGIRLAAAWGWFDQAVATASRQGVYEDYALLYPFPFRGAVTQAAQRFDLPQDWIYGVIRQESLYNADAVSSAAACGLMQIRPSTAREIAQRHQLPDPPNCTALLNPQTNVTLGSAHLQHLLQREGGQLVVALAAYNAGHNAAERWLPEDRSLPADVWIENIPYDETRRYVKRILWHIAVFGWRRSGHGQSIAAQMQNIRASSAQTAEAGS